MLRNGGEIVIAGASENGATSQAMFKVTNLYQIYEGEWRKTASKSLTGNKVKKQLLCDIHWFGKHILDLYCLTDMMPICIKCFTEEHYPRGCSVCTINTMKEQE